MIWGVDHIAYSTDTCAYDETVELFQAQGYGEVFNFKGVGNPLVKKELLHYYASQHDLALLTKNGAYSIEVINHNGGVAGSTFIEEITATDCEGDTLVIKTQDMEKSQLFWEQMGFQRDGESCFFSSPLSPSKLYITFVATTSSLECTLDCQGLNCMGLMVKNIEKELERCIKEGLRTTKVEEIELPGKVVHVAFVCGPQSEIVEFIEIVRTL